MSPLKFASVLGYLPAFGLITVLLSCGCSTTQQMYQGEPRPKEEVSRVESWGEFGLFSSFSTAVLSIDGQAVEADAAEILPGSHSVRAGATLSRRYEKMLAQPQEALVFDALAGHTYQIKAHFEVPFFLLGTLESYADEIVPFIWIEDKESGEMVVGDRPPPGQGDDG